MSLRVLLLSWLVFSVSIGAVSTTIFTISTAAIIASLVAMPAVFLLVLNGYSYERLLIVTTISTSNLFLLHKFLAIHTANGDNLFGIRDVLLLATLFGGLYSGRDQLRGFAKHPLVWPGLVIVFLLPTASLLGFINQASVSNVGREIVVFSMWILPLAVAANIRTYQFLRLLFHLFVILGALVSIGVILEVGSFGALHLVSTIREPIAGRTLMRVFPDAWVFIIITYFAAVVGILAKKNVWRNIGIFILAAAAIVLTLQRSTLVVTVGGTVVLLALTAMSRRTDLLARRAVIPFTTLLMIIAACGLAADQISPFLNDWVVTHYKDTAQDAGGRLYELTKVGEVFRNDPVAGVGLGARYRDPLPENIRYQENAGEDGTFCHNFIGFCLVKLGLPGALAFIAFSFAILRRLWGYSFDHHMPETRRIGLTLSSAFLVFLIMAQSANVFGDIRTLPICGLAVGMLVALERLRCVISPSAGSIPSPTEHRP